MQLNPKSKFTVMCANTGYGGFSWVPNPADIGKYLWTSFGMACLYTVFMQFQCVNKFSFPCAGVIRAGLLEDAETFPHIPELGAAC